jgi:hypothetical protein
MMAADPPLPRKKRAARLRNVWVKAQIEKLDARTDC